MAGVTYPTLSSGSVISASELNQNFSDLVGLTRGLTTNNLASNAAITSKQLADRFAPFHLGGYYLHKIGATGSAANLVDLSQTPALWTMNLNPDANADAATDSPGVELDRFIIKLPAGKSAFLCSIVIRAQAVGGTNSPVVWITKNGDVVGNGGLTIAASATAYELGNSSAPYSSVIDSLENDDYLTIGIGRTAATPTMVGLHVDIWCKAELGG